MFWSKNINKYKHKTYSQLIFSRKSPGRQIAYSSYKIVLPSHGLELPGDFLFPTRIKPPPPPRQNTIMDQPSIYWLLDDRREDGMCLKPDFINNLIIKTKSSRTNYFLFTFRLNSFIFHTWFAQYFPSGNIKYTSSLLVGKRLQNLARI